MVDARFILPPLQPLHSDYSYPYEFGTLPDMAILIAPDSSELLFCTNFCFVTKRLEKVK